MLATNFSYVFKNIYELNGSGTAFLSVSLLLRVFFDVLLLLGVVYELDILATNFLCFQKYI